MDSLPNVSLQTNPSPSLFSSKSAILNAPTCRIFWEFFVENREKAFGKLLKFLSVADNKDKLLKILQYVVKLIIVSKSVATKSSTTVDLKSFASTLSLARKLARLGNWLPALQELQDLSKEPENSLNYSLQVISAASSLANDLLDDWICLQKGKLLYTQNYLNVLDRWSTRLWFVSVSIELHFTLKKMRALSPIDFKSSQELQRRQMDLILAAGKQGCDWVFCWWELADWSALGRGSEYVPVVAGLLAASIGAIRGWRKLK